MVGNDSFPHQRMFGEVSKHLSAETSEISKIRPKFRYYSNFLSTLENIIFVIFANYHYYPVSYEVDKAY